jgi:predicted MFS family arabinose efflux permease
MFFAAIAPLLPHYASELGLSKSAAGVLTAAYPAGTLAGSLPAGWLATRIGLKPTVLAGLGLMSVSSVVFGLANDVALLDAARFIQGVGGAASWTGALAWLVAAGPPERRGELVGTAIGAALFGALLGPVLGAAANSLSPEAVFPLVGLIGIVLAVMTVREPAPDGRATGERGLAAALGNRTIQAGLATIVLVGLFFGVLEVLVPLKLDRLGASAAVIGGTFLVGAGLEGLAARPVGRLSDRRGPIAPVRVALAVAVVLAVVLPSLGVAWAVVVLVALAGPAVGSLWTPGAVLLSAGADAARLDQAFAFALMNLSWAAAQAGGAAGGGAVADRSGDWAAFGGLAAVMALGLAWSLAARQRRAAPA